MRFALITTSIALFAAGCSGADAQSPDPKPAYIAADGALTPEQVARDIALAEEAFSRIHPGYTRYASEEAMKGAWANVVAAGKAQGGIKLGDFYLAVNQVLTQIRCDHTKAELPRSMQEARKGQPLYLPLRWEWIDKRGVIETAARGVAATHGEEIVAIDGRSLGEMVEAIAPHIPFDGYTEWSRRSGISQSREFMGGGVDHFGALLWDVPAQARVTLRSAAGETREVSMPRISYAEWRKLGRKSEINFKDAVSFERIGSHAAYISVDTFVNYRDPVKPKAIFQPIFKALLDEGRDALILDLRRNGGGSGGPQYELLANLIDAPYRPLKEMRAKTLDLDGIRPYLWTWDSRALDPSPLGFLRNDDGTYALRRFVSSDLKKVKPAKYAFKGRLFVLTSDTNSSGSTNMTAWLKELDRGVLIGERTGGSAEGPTAGLQFTMALPESGVRLRLPFFHMLNNVSSFDAGLGISPDIAAPMTVEAFRAKRDPALDMAKSMAAQKPA
ncbi:MAG: S41 family peptidase [Pseudomonadota bacterium]